MKKQKLLFFPLLLYIIIGLLSCNNLGDGGNYQTYENIPAVIDWKYEMGGTVMGTPWGYIAAPSLNDVYEGDCIYLYQYKIDFENQPSDNYKTATDIMKGKVNQSFLESYPDFSMLSDYTFPISQLHIDSYAYYNGRLFVFTTCKDEFPELRLVYNTQEPDSAGVKNLFFLAKQSAKGASSSDILSLQAYDMSYFIQGSGRDTTIIASDVEYKLKYVQVQFNYISDILSETGKPIYSTIQSPSEVYIFQ